MKDAAMKMVDEVSESLTALGAIEDMLSAQKQLNEVDGGRLCILIRFVRERADTAIREYLNAPPLRRAA